MPYIWRKTLKRPVVLLIFWLFFCGLVAAAIPAASPALAQDEQPPEGYKRLTTLNVSYTAYQWWLVRWKGNDITCQFTVDHDGLPIADEIKTWCGPSLYNEWKATQPCSLDSQNCPGLYLYLYSSSPAEKEVQVELPLPSVWVSISGCSPQPPDNRCDSPPELQLTGEEPLPNEVIISIQGTANGEPFVCNGDSCAIPLAPTGQQGITVEFWAESSFGDESPHFTAQVRVTAQGDFMSPEGSSSDSPVYYVDVLSDQWRGAPLASCSDTWQAFPDVGGPPAWLTTPPTADNLYSANTLYYLAGMLISNGDVDASACADGGLDSSRVASTCGLQVAQDQVTAWQNKFDNDIFQAAQDTGVPAQLLKNIFNRESQFWPGIYQSYKEAGLGQLTENGADTILLWNPDFFNQFCPLLLQQDRCDLGFGNLSVNEQALLRGGLVSKVNATCEDCATGIDLTQASFSVKVFAEGLKGNCEQVGRIITNVTSEYPGQLSTYSDLWKFTLVNYNAGPGCLANAIQTTYSQGKPLDWDSVTGNLEEACQGAIQYVDDISSMVPEVQPTPTSWVFPGQTPASPGVSPTSPPGVTSTPGPTATPSPTSQGYPAVTQPATPTPEGYPAVPTLSEPTYSYP